MNSAAFASRPASPLPQISRIYLPLNLAPLAMDPEQVARLDLRGEGQSPPFDPVGNTSSKLGGSHSGATVGMEVGVVVGIIALVVITVTGVFLWRARKSRTGPVADVADNLEHDLGTDRPTPPPKDEVHGNLVETGLAAESRTAAIARPGSIHSPSHWRRWGAPRGYTGGKLVAELLPCLVFMLVLTPWFLQWRSTR